MQPVDVWGPYNQSMQNLGNTFANLSAQRDQQAQHRRLNGLQDLQAQSMRQGLERKQAEDQALMSQYGAEDLPRALEFQSEERQMQDDQSRDFAMQKEMLDLIGKIREKGVRGSTINPVIKGLAQNFKNPKLRDFYSKLELDDKYYGKTKVQLDGTEGYIHPQTGKPLAAGVYEMEFDDKQQPVRVDFVKAGEKEFDPITQEASTFLSGKFDMMTPQGRQQALSWFRTPEGQKEWQGYLKTTAVNKSQPVFVPLGANPQTGEPIVMSNRNPSDVRTVKTGGPLVNKTATPMTPEQAAKAQLIDQALTYIPDIKMGILGADPNKPNIDRSNVANLAARTPFTEGRKVSTLILDAVEAKLRAESGAAVPETEVKRIAKRYIPSPFDDDNTIVIKVNNLESFLKGTQEKIQKGRTLTDKPQGKKPLSQY